SPLSPSGAAVCVAVSGRSLTGSETYQIGTSFPPAIEETYRRSLRVGERIVNCHARFDSWREYMTEGAIDPARQEEFVGKVVEQISGTMTTLLGAIGDRLGLFKNLAEQGPATSTELASRTKLNERYLREWLGGMA